MGENLIPRLRQVDLMPIKYEEQDLFLLRDQQGLAPEPLLLSPASVHLLRFFDGQHTVDDMQLELTRMSGQIVPREQLGAFVEKLDEAFFLDSPRFARRQQDYAEEYAAAPHRPVRFAGEAYPADPAALRHELNALYEAPGGPGAPKPVTTWPRAIAAPHIDIRRGAAVYAHAYQTLWASAPERIVVLGVCHAPAPNPFILTVKDYATPLGVMPVDRELIRSLMAKLDWNPLEAQELHRAEHSIEFQVLMLQHALAAGRNSRADRATAADRSDRADQADQADQAVRADRAAAADRSDRADHDERAAGADGASVGVTDNAGGADAVDAAGIPIVPILCGLSWSDFYETEDGVIGTDRRVDEFLTALAEILAEDGGDGSPGTVLVAGIDLAHVGVRFGASDGLDAQKLARLKARDLATLSLVAAGDRDGFVRQTLAERDERHLCGFGALYALLSLLPGADGQVIAYDQSVDPDQSSAVTFAALRFEG